MSVQTWQEALVVAVTEGPTITSNTRSTCLPPQAIYTVRPNFFNVPGKQLQIHASGKISSVVTTPGTARFDVNFHDSAGFDAIVFDSDAILLEPGEAHVDVGWTLDIVLTCLSVTPTAGITGHGVFVSTDIKGRLALGGLPTGSISAFLPWAGSPIPGAAFDPTNAQQIDLRFTQTESTGSLTVMQYTLVSVN